MTFTDYPTSSKLVGAIFKHLPSHPENYSHPETGRQTYIYGMAYENAQLCKCASAVLQELINDCANDGVIKVEDLEKLIEELEGK